jgi:hypothetical protein
MFALMFIVLTSSAPVKPAFTERTLVQQSDERDGRVCQGSSTVKIYEHARDTEGVR